MEKYYNAVTGIDNEEIKHILTRLSYPRLSTQADTAWVEYDPISGRILYYFNPDFLEKLSIKELRFVILHEMFHIIMDHLMDLQEYKDYNSVAMNVAMDIAINDLLTKIIPPDVAISPKEIVTGERVIGQNCAYLSWRVIYDLLPKDNSGGGHGSQNIDDHSSWGMSNSGVMDGQEVVRRITEEVKSKAPDLYKRLQDAIKQLEKTGGKDYGTSPLGAPRTFRDKKCSFWRDVQKFLEKILPKSFLYNWRKRHRAFITSNVIFPTEKIVEDHRRLVVYIDTSGSISEDMLAEFMDGVRTIRRLGVRTLLFTFDTEVYEVIGGEFRGGGGTSFDAVVNHFRSNFRNDYGLVLTDGYSDIRENPKNLFWVITKSDSYIKGKVQENNYIFPGGGKRS